MPRITRLLRKLNQKPIETPLPRLIRREFPATSELLQDRALKEVLFHISNLRGPQGLPGNPGSPGNDGKNAESDTPLEIRNKLQTLKGDDRLDFTAIKGLEEAIKQLVKVLAPRPAFGGGQGSWAAEAPSGTVNGTNATFTLTRTPSPNSLILQVNGQVQRPGSSNEYTISGLTITFNSTDIPQTGDTLFAFYQNG